MAPKDTYIYLKPISPVGPCGFPLSIKFMSHSRPELKTLRWDLNPITTRTNPVGDYVVLVFDYGVVIFFLWKSYLYTVHVSQNHEMSGGYDENWSYKMEKKINNMLHFIKMKKETE